MIPQIYGLYLSNQLAELKRGWVQLEELLYTCIVQYVYFEIQYDVWAHHSFKSM